MTEYFDEAETKKRLAAIGAKLRMVDNMMLALIEQRMALAAQVAWTKSRRRDDVFPNGEPISRPEVETARLNQIAERAVEYGVDPNLARTILAILIDHSCKQQMIRWQSDFFDYGEPTYAEQKANLLELTELVAPSYHTYDEHYPATQMYSNFEAQQIAAQVAMLNSRGLCLDLGCATGRVAADLAAHFDRVIGVDISPHMAELAESNTPDNVTSVVADLESPEFWETLDDASCDFVVMGQGTASDIRGIGYVISQIGRVLTPEGRFALSFYNAEGLVHRWGFQPWTSSLAATLDSRRSCLDVHINGRMLSVFARAYTFEEINDLVGRGLQVTEALSFPTLAAILPREVLEDEVLASVVTGIDNQLSEAGSADGAYTLAVGRK